MCNWLLQPQIISLPRDIAISLPLLLNFIKVSCFFNFSGLKKPNSKYFCLNQTRQVITFSMISVVLPCGNSSCGEEFIKENFAKRMECLKKSAQQVLMSASSAFPLQIQNKISKKNVYNTAKQKNTLRFTGWSGYIML